MQSPARHPDEPLDCPASSEESSKRGFLERHLDWLRRGLRRFRTSGAHPPWFDARGIGVGLFVGLAVPIGVQMMSLGLLRLVLRFNTVMAFAFTCVNNPVTLLPMYYGFYCVGSLILDEPMLMSAEDFHALMRPVISGAYFWESVRPFLALGGDLLERCFVGASVVGGIAGLLGYGVSYRVCVSRCKRKAKRLGISYEHLVRNLESDTRQKDQRI